MPALSKLNQKCVSSSDAHDQSTRRRHHRTLNNRENPLDDCQFHHFHLFSSDIYFAPMYNNNNTTMHSHNFIIIITILFISFNVFPYVRPQKLLIKLYFCSFNLLLFGVCCFACSFCGNLHAKCGKWHIQICTECALLCDFCMEIAEKAYHHRKLQRCIYVY